MKTDWSPEERAAIEAKYKAEFTAADLQQYTEEEMRAAYEAWAELLRGLAPVHGAEGRLGLLVGRHVREDVDDLLGVGALKELEPRSGEIKSMRTADAHLRKGVAAAILDHIVAEARRRGYSRLSLETGSGPAFEPALTLYRKYGFVDGEPFGGYEKSPFNQFLHLDLQVQPTATRHPLTEEQIRAALDGNLCRCGAHLRSSGGVGRDALASRRRPLAAHGNRVGVDAATTDRDADHERRGDSRTRGEHRPVSREATVRAARYAFLR